MIDQGNTLQTGERDWRRCEVERAETVHREEETGQTKLWRCVSCGYAQGENLRVPTVEEYS